MNINTKEMIYDKAIELFLETGYHKVSVNQICAALNLTKGAFYHHYDSKEELLVVFYEKLYEREQVRINEILHLENPVERVWQLILFTTEEKLQLGSDLFFRVLLVHVKKNDFGTPVISDQNAVTATKRALLAGIKEGQAAGTIRQVAPPEDLLSAFVHGFLGLSILWDQEQMRFELIPEVRQLFTIIFLAEPV